MSVLLNIMKHKRLLLIVTIILMNTALTTCFPFRKHKNKKYSCRRLCNGDYDICMSAIKIYTESLVCLYNAMRCRRKCKLPKKKIKLVTGQ